MKPKGRDKRNLDVPRIEKESVFANCFHIAVKRFCYAAMVVVTSTESSFMVHLVDLC